MRVTIGWRDDADGLALAEALTSPAGAGAKLPQYAVERNRAWGQPAPRAASVTVRTERDVQTN
jgi:hypothetical protein